jgi:hypothetical protein
MKVTHRSSFCASIGALLALSAACSGSAVALGVDDGGGASTDYDSGIAPSGQDSGASTSIDASTAHDGGGPANEGGGPANDGGAPAHDGGGPASDSGTVHDSGGPPPPPKGDAGDGTPTRQACTGNFGSALSSTHGRLDGTLVSIVGLGGGQGCNGDGSHVHLQVKMNGGIYDVAVNSDTLIAERDLPLPDGAWSEGWHTSDALDYAQLGLHSGDFTKPSSPSALAQQIESALANANHVSVFATGYGPSGAHLVHRNNGGGSDGAIVIYPLSTPAHVMMFTFTTTSPF